MTFYGGATFRFSPDQVVGERIDSSPHDIRIGDLIAIGIKVSMGLAAGMPKIMNYRIVTGLLNVRILAIIIGHAK
jgi:hypothetical protein